MKQYRNVQNILINGKKCSVCKGWYKKGETIHKKWYSELLGENI